MSRKKLHSLHSFQHTVKKSKQVTLIMISRKKLHSLHYYFTQGGQLIGMPKSSSERSSKSESSDSEFVFGGVKFNSGIDMGEGGRERDGDLGGDGDLGVERGILGVVERGIWGGEMGIWVVETVMWRVVERGIWGWGSLPILPSKESSGREWRGNWYCRGTRMLWRGGSWGWGSLPILSSKESSGRKWRLIGIAGNPHIVVCPCFSLDL